MTADTRVTLYHGLSKDKRYWRWRIIHNRCYNKKNQAYSSYGAKGTVVDWAWHKDNPDGLVNFLEWIDVKLAEAGKPLKYVLALVDKTKNYGPTNCMISNQQRAIQSRPMNSYTAEQVVEMRRYARANPDTTLEGLVAVFGGTGSSMSRALTGTTYSNVNAIEPPIPFKKSSKPVPHPNASIFALAASLI
jgi:hypothetical protein